MASASLKTPSVKFRVGSMPYSLIRFTRAEVPKVGNVSFVSGCFFRRNAILPVTSLKASFSATCVFDPP